MLKNLGFKIKRNLFPVITCSLALIILLIFLFANNGIENLRQLIPQIQGVWLLFSGVTRLVMAAVLLRGKAKCWRITGLVGLALLLLGLISQYGFAAVDGYAGLFEGLAFLLEGANALFLWWLWNDLPGCGEENTDTHMAIRK